MIRHARVLAIALLASCGGDDATTPPDAPAVSHDAAVDAPGLASTCSGACAHTSLVAMLAATRTLDTAYFGVNASGSLHVEVYAGAAPGCPTMTSPTPDYTLVLGGVPAPTATAAVTSPGNVLDYQGDLLNGPLGAQATSVMLVPTAYAAGMLIAFDATIAFAQGTAAGHVYATHCASLDE